jgi:hypothetical protein
VKNIFLILAVNKKVAASAPFCTLSTNGQYRTGYLSISSRIFVSGSRWIRIRLALFDPIRIENADQGPGARALTTIN